MRQKIAAGNWKMNGLKSALGELENMAQATNGVNAETIICTPFHLIGAAIELSKTTQIKIGAQNCHQLENGAYTGEVSAPMIADIGASHVILGHSERREYFGETSELVAEKAAIAHKNNLVAIICVGETLKEREAGQALDIVGRQIGESIPSSSDAKNTIIAYEPVWAIGTGKVPSNEDIQEMHAHIRGLIPDAQDMRILYGGSVKGANAAEIFSIDNVDGALVGGASLKADDFVPIVQAASSLSK